MKNTGKKEMPETSKYAPVKAIIKRDTGGKELAVYPSVKQAAEQNSINYQYLGNCIRAGKTCKGFVYGYYRKPFSMPVPVRAASKFQMNHRPYGGVKNERERSL